jgi:DNA repair protein RecO (recombination protein O)
VMDSKVLLQPAYVLHRQAFRNTSLLLDFFCLDYGRVKAVARGARSAKSKYRGLVHPFQPLLVSFAGRGDLKTLTTVEASVSSLTLKGARLFSGLYVNELLTRLLHNHIESKQLYNTYQETLLALHGDQGIEPALRGFELKLLNELGYGINLRTECGTDLPIKPSENYHFIPDIGFERIATSGHSAFDEKDVVLGAHIIALCNLDFSDGAAALTSKRLLRKALALHLGDKPLASRALFRQIA